MIGRFQRQNNPSKPQQPLDSNLMDKGNIIVYALVPNYPTPQTFFSETTMGIYTVDAVS